MRTYRDHSNYEGYKHRMNLQFFAEEAEDGEEKPEQGEEVKTYTQEEVDQMLQSEGDKRVTEALETAKKKWEKEKKEEQEKIRTEAERLAQMTEQEKAEAMLKKEKEELMAEKASLEKEKMKIETARALREQGLSEDFVPFLMGENAESTTENIKSFKKVFEESVKRAVSEQLKGKPPAAGASESGIVNPWSKDHFNLTEQGRILREDPELAARLQNQR